MPYIRRRLVRAAATVCALISVQAIACAQQLMPGPVPSPGQTPTATSLFASVSNGQLPLAPYLVIWLLPIAGVGALAFALWADRHAKESADASLGRRSMKA